MLSMLSDLCLDFLLCKWISIWSVFIIQKNENSNFLRWGKIAKHDGDTTVTPNEVPGSTCGAADGYSLIRHDIGTGEGTH